MSYKPLHEMSDAEVAREARVWERAVVDSQVSQWVEAADRHRNNVYGEIRRRRAPEVRT